MKKEGQKRDTLSVCVAMGAVAMFFMRKETQST